MSSGKWRPFCLSLNMLMYWLIGAAEFDLIKHRKIFLPSIILRHWDRVVNWDTRWWRIRSPWIFTWWRHQMETFSALLAICAANSPVPGEFPAQRPVTRSFDVFFDLRPNKQLSKQSWGWWFETQSRPLSRNLNGISQPQHQKY